MTRPDLALPDLARSSLARSNLDRRRFLKLGGAGLIAGASALGSSQALNRLALLDAGAGSEAVAYAPNGQLDQAIADAGLVLVVIELEGGLDGFNTVIPYESGAYRDLRGPGALDADNQRVLDDTFALHGAMPNLARRWDDGDLAIVHGVGIEENSLSHFTSVDVWNRGRVHSGDGTGWIARALDGAVADRDPLVGVSIGYLTPAMYGDGWSAVALPDDGALPWSASFIDRHPGIVAAYQQMLQSPSADDLSLGQRVRNSQHLVRSVADSIGSVTDLGSIVAAAELLEAPDLPDDVYVGDGLLAARLSMVADLITGGLPTRAYHVLHGGFDTHASQQASLPYLLGELDSAIELFHQALGVDAERVIIATRSEFGRRPKWNGSGTDHGSAGVQLVVGPRVVGGHRGEPSPLTRFDEDENFIVTTDFRQYLGGLTHGAFGVDPERVVPGTRNYLELIA